MELKHISQLPGGILFLVASFSLFEEGRRELRGMEGS